MASFCLKTNHWSVGPEVRPELSCLAEEFCKYPCWQQIEATRILENSQPGKLTWQWKNWWFQWRFQKGETDIMDKPFEDVAPIKNWWFSIVILFFGMVIHHSPHFCTPFFGFVVVPFQDHHISSQLFFWFGDVQHRLSPNKKQHKTQVYPLISSHFWKGNIIFKCFLRRDFLVPRRVYKTHTALERNNCVFHLNLGGSSAKPHFSQLTEKVHRPCIPKCSIR